MTKVNPQSSAQDIPDLDDDDMPSEYSFTGNGVRGKYYKAIQEHGYSVTVHHQDGTSTTRHVSPSEVMEQSRQRELLKAFNQSAEHPPNQTWTDAIAGNKIVNSQNLTQAAQDIKTLLDQLTIDYPNDDEFTQAGRAVGAIKNNPTLKQCLLNAAKESGTTAVEKAIEAVVDNPAVSIIIAGVKGFITTTG
jgi:hypothetical protein